jgi:S1-C subfamily serine protease
VSETAAAAAGGRPPVRLGIALLVLVVGATAAACDRTSKSHTAAGRRPPPAVSGATPTSAPAPGQGPDGLFSVIPGVVRRLQPSVVTILTDNGLGSGVIWSSDGIVVTADHVVAGQSSVRVAFADGQRVAATVQAADPITDVAVVKAQRQGLPPARFADELPPVGALAIAIGSPLGFEETVTAGIISGTQRSIPGSGQRTESLVDLLQTDAPISPGNSGGALVDAGGSVIGLNEAYIPPSAGAVSIGFAIPASTVRDVVGQLLRTGHARHAYLGLQLGELTPEIAAELQRTTGALVLDVVAGGPAARAGLQPGDVIVRFDDTRIATVEDVLAALRGHQPGDTVTLTYDRNGKQAQAAVTLSERPAPP